MNNAVKSSETAYELGTLRFVTGRKGVQWEHYFVALPTDEHYEKFMLIADSIMGADGKWEPFRRPWNDEFTNLETVLNEEAWREAVRTIFGTHGYALTSQLASRLRHAEHDRRGLPSNPRGASREEG